MAEFKVLIRGDRLSEKRLSPSIGKLCEGLGATFRIQKVNVPTSRADRYSEAQSQVSDAKGEMESLRDELQEWLDNLPDNFRDGDKGQDLESAIGQLEDSINGCETVESIDVDFPGMY
jgi:uncharacterized phage infection (PIP) family protein YhgE